MAATGRAQLWGQEEQGRASENKPAIQTTVEAVPSIAEWLGCSSGKLAGTWPYRHGYKVSVACVHLWIRMCWRSPVDTNVLALADEPICRVGLAWPRMHACICAGCTAICVIACHVAAGMRNKTQYSTRHATAHIMAAALHVLPSAHTCLGHQQHTPLLAAVPRNTRPFDHSTAHRTERAVGGPAAMELDGDGVYADTPSTSSPDPAGHGGGASTSPRKAAAACGPAGTLAAADNNGAAAKAAGTGKKAKVRGLGAAQRIADRGAVLYEVEGRCCVGGRGANTGQISAPKVPDVVHGSSSSRGAPKVLIGLGTWVVARHSCSCCRFSFGFSSAPFFERDTPSISGT